MEMICPVCNGLNECDIECEKCSGEMTNRGRIAEYYDNYSSYLEMSLTEKIDGVPSDKCVHLYACLDCNYDKRVTIDKVLK